MKETIYDMSHANSVIRVSEGTCFTLTARMGTGGNQVPLVLSEPETIGGGHDMTICLSENGNDRAITVDKTPPLKTTTPCFCADDRAETPHNRVRKLMPVECERLQGFPDGWTQIPYRGKPAEQCPDSPRYKALGNSWAVPVVRWIGRRIQNEIDKPSE